MLALGIITLFLTAFMLGFYGYIGRHDDEHDISFFMSVGLIFMVMNLGTNAAGGGALGLSWLYLVVDIAFLALGFAVSVEHSIGFYKSLFPWCKRVFTGKFIGWQLLSFICFPAGLVFYFVWSKTDKTERALECGKMALWGALLWIIVIWTIFAIIGAAAPAVAPEALAAIL